MNSLKNIVAHEESNIISKLMSLSEAQTAVNDKSELNKTLDKQLKLAVEKNESEGQTSVHESISVPELPELYDNCHDKLGTCEEQQTDENPRPSIDDDIHYEVTMNFFWSIIRIVLLTACTND